jgi:hypothetical protein
MATSCPRIFMRLNIFLFEVWRHSDFLDPEFFDACSWLQDPPKSGCPFFCSSFMAPGPINMDPHNLGMHWYYKMI